MKSEASLWPNIIPNGTLMISPTGCKVKILHTTQRKVFIEQHYRMLYESGIKGRRIWTREELQATGMTIVYG